MLDKEILEKLSYACGCDLDIKEELGVINGRCKTHPKNVLLYEGMDIVTYRKFVQAREKRNAKNN